MCSSPTLRSVALFVLAVCSTVNAADKVLKAPDSPPKDHNVVDAAFQSYSIEFNYMLDYAGNNSHPNKFSIRMLDNLESISGTHPFIRVGGTTQNRAVYLSNQTTALNQTFSRPWDDQPSKLSIGPKWFESFQQFPKDIKYVYGLNFYDGEFGLNNTVTQATAAHLALGQHIHAYEIGNEVSGWAGTTRRPENWTIYDYVEQWTQYSEAIRDDIRKQPGHEKDTPYFQGCAYVAPRARQFTANDTWNVANTVRIGMGKSNMLRSVADHDYMGANCPDSPVPTIKDNLLNHHHMTSLMYWHELLGEELYGLGVPYVLGETNSISCQGTANVSDVFAAALWAIDYTLYVANLRVERLYFHSGSPYRYAPWQPTTINDTAPYAKPLYYGNLFTSAALAGGQKSVVSIANETTFAAYAIYDVNGDTQNLSSVALVNLEMWNSTQGTEERPSLQVQLPVVASSWEGAQVRRLTAPGVEVKSGVTFAGRQVNSDGKLSGKEIVEYASSGTVRVGASEAVLVTL